MLPSDTQRFLQLLATEKIMSDDDVRREVTTIFGEQCSDRQINLINRELEKFNFTIKPAHCEVTGRKYWIFMSNVTDKTMKYPGDFTDIQLEFIRKVFSEIINSDDGHASSITCINVRSQMTGKISPVQAEALLNQLDRQRWLSIMEGRVYMGVRSIGELMSYFKDSYIDGLNTCPSCRHTVFYGQRCENCQSVAHLYCLSMMAKHSKTLKCMRCKAPINAEELPVMERTESMEVDNDEESLEETQSTQSSRKSHRSQKSKGRG